MFRMENWSCTSYEHEPEEVRRLQGNVHDNPKFEDGTFIVSSVLVGIAGKVATTASGSVYELGEVDPNFKEWIKENYPNWDPENPIKTVFVHD